MDVVDAVGGIEFDVPQDMDYEDPSQDLYIHLKKGVCSFAMKLTQRAEVSKSPVPQAFLQKEKG